MLIVVVSKLSRGGWGAAETERPREMSVSAPRAARLLSSSGLLEVWARRELAVKLPILHGVSVGCFRGQGGGTGDLELGHHHGSDMAQGPAAGGRELVFEVATENPHPTIPFQRWV